jgi:hypothetical protein
LAFGYFKMGFKSKQTLVCRLRITVFAIQKTIITFSRFKRQGIIIKAI